jgi:DeoR/GlpR family transcriptional regulator of sugar metabolism
MNDRRKNILKLIAEQEKLSVNELSGMLNVSGVTIRQDLSDLEKQGLLKRVHGGAVLNSSDNISNRLIFRFEEKQKIAAKAAEFVNDGDTVFIESGSANTLLAMVLAKKKNVTILTTNIFIARELKAFKDAKVVVLGGMFQAESECLVGQLTKFCIENVNFDKAFIGVDGYTADAGFTGKDMLRAETAAAIVKKSKKSFVLTDSSKFGKSALIKMFDDTDINYLITDKVSVEIKHVLEKSNIKIFET